MKYFTLFVGSLLLLISCSTLDQKQELNIKDNSYGNLIIDEQRLSYDLEPVDSLGKVKITFDHFIKYHSEGSGMYITEYKYYLSSLKNKRGGGNGWKMSNFFNHRRNLWGAKKFREGNQLDSLHKSFDTKFDKDDTIIFTFLISGYFTNSKNELLKNNEILKGYLYSKSDTISVK